MRIKVREGSDYLKGMLLIARRDRKIADSEIRLVEHVGAALGFDSRFCVDAIGEVLENKYLVDTPPEFSSAGLAEKFVRDGLVLAASDSEVHPSEEQWLKSAVAKNGLCLAWFRQECADVTAKVRFLSRLDVDDLAVEYY